MSFRGRGGRGGGRGGRGGRGGFGAGNFGFQAKHTPHEDFPEITLPEMTCSKATNEEKALIQSTLKLEEFMRNSCYHLELDAPKKKNDDKEIERFSDRKRKTQSKRESLKSYLKLTPGNFPAELLDGFKQVQPSNKKLRWDKDSVDKAFEVFEKLEEKHKGFGTCRMEKTRPKRMVKRRMSRTRRKQKRKKVQMMIITRISSLMMTTMTGTKRRKHRKTAMINDRWPLKGLTALVMFSFLGILLHLQLIEKF